MSFCVPSSCVVMLKSHKMLLMSLRIVVSW